MPPREDDAVDPRPVAPAGRRLLLPAGFALAVLATLAVFLTDNEQYLRVAVVAIAWAFVLATFALARRDTDRVEAAARETELRHSYEVELDREVAARREYELELEHELRREAEESMRYELDALRGDIAELAGLRDEVARVSDLRGDILALSGLRDEIARVAALRDDIAALTSLRQDLGQLAELRADMGRLRAELTEQLSSEMLVERIVMRTQASRLPGEPARRDGDGRTLEGSSSWADDVPPRELTAGWPAVRLDEPRETRQFEQVQAERPVSRAPEPAPRPSAPEPAYRPSAPEPATAWRPSWESTPAEPIPWDAPLPTWDSTGTATWVAAPPPPAAEPPSRHAAAEPAGPPPTTFSEIAPSSIARPPVVEPPATTFSEIAPSSIARPPVPEPPLWQSSVVRPPETQFQEVRRPLLDRPPVPPVPPPPSPLDWLAARSLLDAPAPTSSRPEVPPLRRRDDETREAPGTYTPAEPRTTHRPTVPPAPPLRSDDRGGHRVPVRDEEPATAPGSAHDKRLADILAENGVSPSAGGRRRRRYRDEDESDDVLARVLGRS